MELGRILNIDMTPDLAMVDTMENPELQDGALEMLLKGQQMTDGALGRALNLALLGEYDLAMDNLEKAFKAGDPYAINMNRWASLGGRLAMRRLVSGFGTATDNSPPPLHKDCGTARGTGPEAITPCIDQ